jgi:hypothetical protein
MRNHGHASTRLPADRFRRTVDSTFSVRVRQLTLCASKRLMHRSKQHLCSITSSARLSNVAGISMPAVSSAVNNRVLNYVNFPLVRISRFGSTSSVWSNAGRPRTSSPSWHLPILRSYSSKSWLVPRFSLQIYCTAKAVGKALPLAAIVLQMLMTTLQERLMPKRSSSCPSLCRSHRALGLANVQLTPAAGPGAELAISHLVMPDKLIPVTD